MPRVCTICTHSEREAIDAALLAGEPYRNIAKRTGTSPAALTRHKAEHIPATLAKAQEAAEVAHADNLLDQVRGLQSKTLAILSKAEKSGDLRTAVSAIAQARGNLELLGKLMGEMNEGATVNILVNPEWHMVRAVIVQALDSYPEARLAVATALQRVEHVGG